MYYHYFYRTHTLADLFALAMALATWVLLWWLALSKMGFRKELRLFLLVGMCLPPIAPFVLLGLLLFPWPVWRELRKLREQVKTFVNSTSTQTSVNEDLERLRREMGNLG